MPVVGTPAELLAAAGFAGAAGANSIGSAMNRDQIQQARIGSQGEQARQGINDSYETRGMYQSSNRLRDVAYQASDQANSSGLSTLGVQDAQNSAYLSAMQDLAQQQIQQQQIAQQKQAFDAQLALQYAQLGQQSGGGPIDPTAVANYLGQGQIAPGAGMGAAAGDAARGQSAAQGLGAATGRGW